MGGVFSFAATMPNQNQIVVAVELRAAKARTENFLGREFSVIPAVLVRSQILRNNLGVTFLPAQDITEEWAGLWNGIPVLVGPHPSHRGIPTSGRNPQLWNERCAGWIFGAKAVQESDDVRHLAGEVWLDMSRADAVDGLQAVLDRVASGAPVELSTGFPAQLVATQGFFQGSAYEAVMHPVGADHLVISTEMTGACSVSDGCGLGVNKYQGTPPMENQNANDKKKGLAGLMDRVTGLFNSQRESQNKVIAAQEERVAHLLQRELDIINALPASDTERSNYLRAALQDRYGSRGEVIVCDVYSETKEVIFWLITPLGSEPQGPDYFRVNYTEGENGAITFGEPEKVRRRTVYEVVGNTDDAPSSTTATNCHCASTEEATMSDKNNAGSPDIAAALATLTSSVQSLATNVDALSKDVTAIKEAAKQDPNPAIAGLKKTIGQLAEQVASMKGVTETAVQERERERQNLVQELAGHFKVPFTADELEAKPLDELRKLAEMARGNDFSGRGGPRGSAVNSEQRFAEPQPYWKKDDAQARGGK